jgi:predicted dehydrogenase
MDVKFPTKVSSVGGRYYFKDDWETPDTQMVNIEFGKDMSMLWEGYSCSGRNIDNSSVASVFYGDSGILHIGSGNEYRIFDKNNNVVKDSRNDAAGQQNSSNPPGGLDAIHINNFFDAIRKGTPMAAPAEAGHKATLLMQLANISLRTGRSLDINPANGHIVNDSEAQRYWSRSYEPGWEPKV